jgi:hypothetical protein
VKWIKSWQVKSESGNGVYTVSLSDTGEYGCSCPVWKFKREECKHIRYVKDFNPTGESQYDGKEARPGNVGQVTEIDGILLYPLVPIEPFNTHLAATIIYDLLKLGAKKEKVKDYKDKMFSRSSLKDIIEYVEIRGRYVYTEFIQGRGWTNPQIVKIEKVRRENGSHS